ncbi:MAG TPA: nitroreductase [Bacillota bacterium]|nr:nitroreductase [Bacillota bacterium]
MTNDALKNLEARRSVRAFKDGMISDDELKAVLEAGTFAPTGMNRQSPLIVALRDAKTIKKLSELNRSFMPGASGDPFYGAPVVIAVFADRNVRTYVEDGSLVIGNMLNAAASLELGGCWIHRAKEEFETPEGRAMCREWGVGDEYEGIGHCILGYPAPGAIRPAKPRKDGYYRIIG